jgi:hypothetical protein
MIPSFPNYIFIDDSSLQRVTRDNLVKSDMEIGPQKSRPKQSVPMYQISMRVSICDDKLNTWRAWFRTNLGSGAYWFLMNDPFDGTRRRFRFVETELNWVKSGNLLQTSFVLEAYDELL